MFHLDAARQANPSRPTHVRRIRLASPAGSVTKVTPVRAVLAMAVITRGVVVALVSHPDGGAAGAARAPAGRLDASRQGGR
jgi:hypothetical protein